MPTISMTKKQARILHRIVKSYLPAEGDTTDPLVQELVQREAESQEPTTSKKRSKAKKKGKKAKKSRL